MSGPTRMGIGLPTGEGGGPRQVHCPGAMLRITREDYRAMRSLGAVFTTASDDIRADGYSDARLLCHDDVALIRVRAGKEGGRDDGRTVFALYHAALCSRCAEEERNNRADLASRKAATGGSR